MGWGIGLGGASVGNWPAYNASMLFWSALHPQSRTSLSVLVLWWCVLCSSAVAPWLQAHAATQGMERLCSGHGAVQWVASPVALDTAHAQAGAHSLLDCPLCMPALGPLPQCHGWVAPPAQAAPVPLAPVPQAAQVLAWPPARGPPAFLASNVARKRP